MSFLDNLENNLKALESQEEKDPQALARKAAQREAARSAALEIAPYAEALRNGPFKDGLLTACRDIGHRRRILVRPIWIFDASSGSWRQETGVASYAERRAGSFLRGGQGTGRYEAVIRRRLPRNRLKCVVREWARPLRAWPESVQPRLLGSYGESLALCRRPPHIPKHPANKRSTLLRLAR